VRNGAEMILPELSATLKLSRNGLRGDPPDPPVVSSKPTYGSPRFNLRVARNLPRIV
jgi:hypothetical protein